MAIFVHILSIIFYYKLIEVYARGPVYTPPDVERVTDRFNRVPIDQSYNVSFGGSNAALKLPSGFTSGVVVAYYLSNANVFPHNHDEIDIELLGHEKRREWVLQTNIYGNGSVSTGREEKFYLWFDPTQAFHDYTILWNNHHIVFMVDNIPVREVIHNNAISSAYPSKPMSLYTTIWDGSKWATHGGKYGVNYKFAPFVVTMKGVEIEGCIVNNSSKDDVASFNSCSRSSSLSNTDPVDGLQFAKLSAQQLNGLGWVRRKHMFYSYCQDKNRYKGPVLSGLSESSLGKLRNLRNNFSLRNVVCLSFEK